MFDRRVFICSPTPKLLERIHTLGDGHLQELEEEVVVISGSVDFDRDIDGWGPLIGQAAKRMFVENLVGDAKVFRGLQELADMLGPGTSAEVFDRWFVLRRVDFLEMGSGAWRQMI